MEIELLGNKDIRTRVKRRSCLLINYPSHCYTNMSETDLGSFGRKSPTRRKGVSVLCLPRKNELFEI